MMPVLAHRSILIALLVLAPLAGCRDRRLEEAKRQTALAELASIKIAVAMFEVDEGRYPRADEGLRAVANGKYMEKGWAGTDPWERPYQYRYPNAAGGFEVYSLGPDGRDNTEDDVRLPAK
jgi:general secretion pathway protein G